MSGIAELLPAADGDPDAPASGSVFKIERTAAGEKVAYVRLFTGTLRIRDHVRYGTAAEATVTAISVFGPGGVEQRSAVTAGQIAKLSGLAGVRIGDPIGDAVATGTGQRFPRPTLESVVAPRQAADKGRLRSALAELSEQDPLIDVRQDDERQEISVSLYGEVQKEVIGETLARDYGIDVSFHETTIVHVERPLRRGEAAEVIHAQTKTNIAGESSPHSTNPYAATMGLRIDPAAVDSGVEFRLAVEVRFVPLYIYKTVGAFIEHMTGYVRDALREGLRGWQVTDCIVTMTRSGYFRTGSTAGDFRKLTPLVLRQALERAGTQVCEPMADVRLDLPTEATSAVLSLLARLRARVEPPMAEGDLSTIRAVLPMALLHELQRRLPTLTAGEGVLESRFAGNEPVTGPVPTRRPTSPRPSEPR
jgi:ribosomal protection tetracycline resistance protein